MAEMTPPDQRDAEPAALLLANGLLWLNLRTQSCSVPYQKSLPGFRPRPPAPPEGSQQGPVWFQQKG